MSAPNEARHGNDLTCAMRLERFLTQPTEGKVGEER